MATLSGLKLEGEITGLQSSVQYKEKIRAPTKAVVEASVVGNMQETKIMLLEGELPNQQVVVKVHCAGSKLKDIELDVTETKSRWYHQNIE